MKIVIIGNGKIASDCLRIMLQNESHSIEHVFYEEVKNPEPAALLTTLTEFDLNASPIQKIHDAENIEILNRIAPDWIFNINCYQYLRSAIIASASKGVINFHNGPLPLYGGVNISSWPIINGETHHGVTWHLVNEGIDTGDILSQSFFEIGRRWTAAKLMTVCILEGIQLFEKNWTAWISGAIKAQPQSAPHSYYSLKDTPPNEGLISFETSAPFVDALVRGLHLFPFTNSFGYAKMNISDQVFIVIQTKVEEGNAQAKPGQVLSFNEKGLVIQCAEGAIHIQSIANLELQPISWPNFKKLVSISEGDICA